MPEVSRIAAATVAAVAGGASLNEQLPQALATLGVGSGQRAALQDTVYGTLRWGVRLDAMLGRLLTQPNTAPALRALLQVGLYRLFYGRLPAHTAVNLLVEAAPHTRKGFVNAVLRRCSESVHDRPADPTKPETEIEMETKTKIKTKTETEIEIEIEIEIKTKTKRINRQTFCRFEKIATISSFRKRKHCVSKDFCDQ